MRICSAISRPAFVDQAPGFARRTFERLRDVLQREKLDSAEKERDARFDRQRAKISVGGRLPAIGRAIDNAVDREVAPRAQEHPIKRDPRALSLAERVRVRKNGLQRRRHIGVA